MPKIVREDLWKVPTLPGMWVVTTNSYIRNNGTLVMGRGAAREATFKLPNVEFLAGAEVERVCGRHFDKAYGFLTVPPPTDTQVGFGLFQVKWHWKNPASLGLIQMSVEKLAEICNEYLSKGRQVYVEGELNADENGNPKTFSRNDGSPGASYEITAQTAQTVKFLGGCGGGNDGGPSESNQQAPPPPAEETEIPF